MKRLDILSIEQERDDKEVADDLLERGHYFEPTPEGDEFGHDTENIDKDEWPTGMESPAEEGLVDDVDFEDDEPDEADLPDDPAIL